MALSLTTAGRRTIGNWDANKAVSGVWGMFAVTIVVVVLWWFATGSQLWQWCCPCCIGGILSAFACRFLAAPGAAVALMSLAMAAAMTVISICHGRGSCTDWVQLCSSDAAHWWIRQSSTSASMVDGMIHAWSKTLVNYFSASARECESQLCLAVWWNGHCTVQDKGLFPSMAKAMPTNYYYYRKEEEYQLPCLWFCFDVSMVDLQEKAMQIALPPIKMEFKTCASTIVSSTSCLSRVLMMATTAARAMSSQASVGCASLSFHVAWEVCVRTQTRA